MTAWQLSAGYLGLPWGFAAGGGGGGMPWGIAPAYTENDSPRRAHAAEVN